jgi:hypothetical protein
MPCKAMALKLSIFRTQPTRSSTATWLSVNLLTLLSLSRKRRVKDLNKILPTTAALLRGRMDIHPDVDTLLHSSSIRVRRVAATSFDERFYLYFFSFEDEQYQNDNWTLAVRSAANAVLAIRERWGDSQDNLVSNSLRYGIPFGPFHTFQVPTQMHSHRDSRQILPSRLPLHAVRKPGW